MLLVVGSNLGLSMLVAVACSILLGEVVLDLGLVVLVLRLGLVLALWRVAFVDHLLLAVGRLALVARERAGVVSPGEILRFLFWLVELRRLLPRELLLRLEVRPLFHYLIFLFVAFALSYLMLPLVLFRF